MVLSSKDKSSLILKFPGNVVVLESRKDLAIAQLNLGEASLNVLYTCLVADGSVLIDG